MPPSPSLSDAFDRILQAPDDDTRELLALRLDILRRISERTKATALAIAKHPTAYALKKKD